jgi:hypothetical protein
LNNMEGISLTDSVGTLSSLMYYLCCFCQKLK